MKIVVSDFIEKVNTKAYQQMVVDYPTTDFEKLDVQDLATKLWDQLQQLLSQDQLATAIVNVEVGAQKISLSLETSIINLPWENINRVDNFFADATQSVEVNVYLIVRAETLNQSGLKIQQVATVADFQTQAVQPEFIIKIAELMAIIQKNQAKEA